MDRFTALLDANVLYAAGIRDILLRLAARNLYQPKWSDTIEEEWRRNLRANRPDLEDARLQRVSDEMNRHFPDARIGVDTRLLDGLKLPDPNDRHVLAAAIQVRADVIITLNTKDFPASSMQRYRIEVQHPDVFIAALFDLYHGSVVTAVRDHRAALRNPPRSADEHIAAMEKLGLVRLAAILRDYRDVL